MTTVMFFMIFRSGMALCTLFYLLTGRKEFKRIKWVAAWKYHKRRLLCKPLGELRSEEHTSELQSPVPISYAVFCLKKKKN